MRSYKRNEKQSSGGIPGYFRSFRDAIPEMARFHRLANRTLCRIFRHVKLVGLETRIPVEAHEMFEELLKARGGSYKLLGRSPRKNDAVL